MPDNFDRQFWSLKENGFSFIPPFVSEGTRLNYFYSFNPLFFLSLSNSWKLIKAAATQSCSYVYPQILVFRRLHRDTHKLSYNVLQSCTVKCKKMQYSPKIKLAKYPETYVIVKLRAPYQKNEIEYTEWCSWLRKEVKGLEGTHTTLFLRSLFLKF